MFCIQCGEKQLNDNAKNCYKCGAPIPSKDAAMNLASSASQEQKAAPVKKPQNILLILSSGCLGLIFLSMIVVVAVSFLGRSLNLTSSSDTSRSKTPKHSSTSSRSLNIDEKKVIEEFRKAGFTITELGGDHPHTILQNGKLMNISLMKNKNNSIRRVCIILQFPTETTTEAIEMQARLLYSIFFTIFGESKAVKVLNYFHESRECKGKNIRMLDDCTLEYSFVSLKGGCMILCSIYPSE